MTKWSEVFGGSVGTTCSLPGNGNSLYFNQPGIRKAVTVDLDMTMATLVIYMYLYSGFCSFRIYFPLYRTLSFQVNVGISSITGCTVPQNVNEAILLQFSTNGGITWTTILIIAHNNNSGETKMVEIPEPAKTSYTRFRWWQRYNPGVDMAQWSLDNININFQQIVLNEFFEDFESDVPTISDYDGRIDAYCTSNGKGLVLEYVLDLSC